MIGGLVGAGLNAAGLVERKGSDKAVQDIGPFGGGMISEGPGMMGTVAEMPRLSLGGLGGMATQGGFMGNAGGLASQYPLGLIGQIGGINEQLANNGGINNPFGLVGAAAGVNPSMFGGPQMGQAGGLLGNANFFSDPMTIKRVS